MILPSYATGQYVWTGNPVTATVAFCTIMVVPSWNLLPSFTRFSGREKKGTLFRPEKGTLGRTKYEALD